MAIFTLSLQPRRPGPACGFSANKASLPTLLSPGVSSGTGGRRF